MLAESAPQGYGTTPTCTAWGASHITTEAPRNTSRGMRSTVCASKPTGVRWWRWPKRTSLLARCWAAPAVDRACLGLMGSRRTSTGLVYLRARYCESSSIYVPPLVVLIAPDWSTLRFLARKLLGWRSERHTSRAGGLPDHLVNQQLLIPCHKSQGFRLEVSEALSVWQTLCVTVYVFVGLIFWNFCVWI